MTKKFMTRALAIAGLTIAGTSAGFAQQIYHSEMRAVPTNAGYHQPVVASVLLADAQGSLGTSSATLNLTDAQRAQISDLAHEASALQAERDRLWKEYNTISKAPGYNDQMAETQGAPRMFRVVALNKQLAEIADRQEVKLATILNPAQRTAVAQMVSSARAQL
jgi:hypothetical protein